MPAKLETGKKIKRLIHVYGVESWVELTLTYEGASLRIPGTKKRLTCSWTDIVTAMYTPDDVPSFLAGEPLKFLLHEDKKVAKRRAEKKDVY